MAVRRALLPLRWLIGGLIVIYLLGPQSHVEWRDEVAAEQICGRGQYAPNDDGDAFPCKENGLATRMWVLEAGTPGHKHVALYLTTPRLRLFDVDYSNGRWSARGFGVGLGGPRDYRFVPPSP